MSRYRTWQEGIPDDTKSGGPWFVSVPDGGDIEIGYDAKGLPDEYHARLFADAGNATLDGHELVGFLGCWAAKYQEDYELDGLHPVHYDLLVKYGARMDDFKRATNAFSRTPQGSEEANG